MKKKKGIKLVIFDFDGCIANPEIIVRKVAFEMIKKYVKYDINAEKILREEGMRSFIKQSGIGYWRIPLLERKFRKKMGQEFDNVKPYEGIPFLIKHLDKDYTLGIATSNSKKNVRGFLQRYDLFNSFKFIKTNISLFTKAWWLKILIKKYGFKKYEVVMIGDEVRDIQAAKKAGIKSIAATWGLNTRKALEQSNPNYIATKPLEILDIIKKF